METGDGALPPDPEGVCMYWATTSCVALSGCCNDEDAFDALSCMLTLSRSCLLGLQVDAVRAGSVVFDQEAAMACFTPISECQPVPDGRDPAHEAACSNMISGYRPVGSSCDSSQECERPEVGVAVCYHGMVPSKGVCATMVAGTEGECGFSTKSLELTTCPERTFCDWKPTGQSPWPGPPSESAYGFKGECKPYLKEGQACVSNAAGELVTLPCVEGLFCNVDPKDAESSKCRVQKALDDSCTGAASDECRAGLKCDKISHKCRSDEPPALFCFGPPACGNGACDSGESLQSCPGDCGFCGDSFCAPGEKDTCMGDCDPCGNGICDAGEDDPNGPLHCPGDCGPCVHCAEFISGGDPGALCEGSTPLYQGFAACVCMGNCQTECGDNICAGKEVTATCQLCIVNGEIGCGNEYGKCANDL